MTLARKQLAEDPCIIVQRMKKAEPAPHQPKLAEFDQLLQRSSYTATDQSKKLFFKAWNQYDNEFKELAAKYENPTFEPNLDFIDRTKFEYPYEKYF